MTIKLRDQSQSAFFIGGRWVAPRTNATLTVVNPATEDVIAVVPEGGAADMIAAIEAARSAFDAGPWPRMRPGERGVAMLRMAEIMRQRTDELVELDILEVGRAQRQLVEFIFVRTPIDHFVDMAERVITQFRWMEPILPSFGFGMGQGVITHEPRGVTALMTPYNAPFSMNVIKMAPALAAGCTVVLKPSPFTPLSALVLAEIAEEAGIPDGVLNVVPGNVEAGTVMTTHPMVDMVSFTGSDAVGRLVAAQAGASMKRVVLECGGKSANIICDDADVALVLPEIVGNVIVNAGQGCSMLTRTLVHESKHDELAATLANVLATITVGDPADPATLMGPLIREAQRSKVEALIARGVEEGATIAYGGGRPAGLDKGYFIEPTLFVGVENSMAIAQREFFGPVNVLIPFQDDDHAVALANDSDYGLGGGVWAQDPARAFEIAKRLRTGQVSVNGGGGSPLPISAPFGGFKQSGLGREWGEAGLSEFLETKSILLGIKSG